jgi:arabinose-5-phosphate isomerase
MVYLNYDMETFPHLVRRVPMNNIMNNTKKIMEIERDGISRLIETADETFERAVKAILECNGKVIISGVGKSGHVGRKIAATLASTGTPSFFIHSTEGVHGDLGMIEATDIMILISNSGETMEVLSLLPTLKKIGCKLIAITSNAKSTLANHSNVTLSFSYETEADELNLAPSVSSTITLVIGDAIALAVSKELEFKKEDFHLSHPGGSLGGKLYNGN